MKKIKSNLIFFEFLILIFFYRGTDILGNLTTISDITTTIFRKLFFSSDINNSLTNDNTIIQSSTIQTLQNKLLRQLGDWFSFIETRSQGNITISLFVFKNIFIKFFFSLILFNLVVNMNFLV